MIPSHIISERLFPGRDLPTEWAKARPSKTLPPFMKLPISIDLPSLQKLACQSLKDPEIFFADHVGTAFAEEAVQARPSEYCFGLLSALSPAASRLQGELNQLRKMEWLEHHQTLTRKQIVRSLIELNENYNPVIDERNYTTLHPQLKNSEIERIAFLFRSRAVRLRFARLGPGETVRPHIDSSARYALRILIPIFSNEQCSYGSIVDGKQRTWVLEEGQVYFVNGGYVHWARNEGPTDRVVLIFSLDGQEDWDWMNEFNLLPS